MEGVEQGNSEDAVKFQVVKDKFHPPEFYVFVQQGHTYVSLALSLVLSINIKSILYLNHIISF